MSRIVNVRVIGGDVEQQQLVLALGVAAEEFPASAVTPLFIGLSSACRQLAICRNANVPSTTSWALRSCRNVICAWWGARFLVRQLYPVFVREIT